MEFLPRTLLFYILSHAYLYWHVRKLLRSRAARLALLPLFLVMGFFPYVYHHLPAGAAQELFGRAGTFWLPAAFFCLIVFVLADGLSLAALACRRLFPAAALLFFSRRRYFMLLVVLAACLYGYGVYEAHDLRVTRISLGSRKLPADAPALRIVFAADLHIGPQTGAAMLANAVDAMLAEKPDLILLGGDLLDDAFQGTPGDMRELGRLDAPLGVFAVLGNHESFGGYRHAVAALARSGITLLSDEAALAGPVRSVGPVRIVGLDDPDVTAQKKEVSPKEDSRAGSATRDADVARLLREGPEGLFTILLDHRPRLRPDAVGLFDVQLSGHTHGGQIILLQSLLESAYGTPTGYSRHRSEAGESVLFVTTGTGFSKLPIRLLVPPEIVVIDIRRVD